jgi:hypothetical protein
VVQLTGLTGLEGMFGQWCVRVGCVGSSDKAAMHRRRHAASVVSHGFVAVDAYQEVERVEVVLMAGLLKGSDAPSVEGLEYIIQINISSQDFYQTKEPLRSPIYDYQTHKSQHLQHQTTTNHNTHNVQPDRPQAQQLFLFHSVRGQHHPTCSQQQRQHYEATQQRQQRPNQLHAVRPSQQPVDL